MADNDQQKLIALYGPQRTLEREKQAKKFRQSNVHVLQKGMAYDFDAPAESTTRESFKHPIRKAVDVASGSWDSTNQNKTSIALGSEITSTRKSIFQEDFTQKPQQFKGLVIPEDVHQNHWADCNPRFVTSEETVPSIYKADFDGTKSYREWSDGMKEKGKKVGRRNKTTSYQKSTHFTLGSDELEPLSETQLQYRCAEGDEDKTGQREKPSKGDTSQFSCVFRSGDYNILVDNPKDCFLSVQMKDFRPSSTKKGKDQKADDAFMGNNYQTRTHFEFGTSKGKNGSVYHEDFIKDKSLHVPMRQPISLPPPGKVLPELMDAAVSWGKTTSMLSYRQHNIREKEAHRLADMKKNHARHQDLAVSLTSDVTNCTEDRMQSTMGSSYRELGPNARAASLAPPVDPHYRYLESNEALSNPSRNTGRSEAQDAYLALLKSQEEAGKVLKGELTARNTRRQDNKSTHFHFGFDNNTNVSEQRSEYKDTNLPPDESLPAGVTTGSSNKYPIVSHDVDMCHKQRSLKEDDDTETVSSSIQNVLLQRTLLKMDAFQDPYLMKLRKEFLIEDPKLTGSVTVEETRAIVQRLTLDLPERDVDNAIASCSKNGMVNYHEFTLQLSKLLKPIQAQDPHLSSLTGRDYGDPKVKKLTPMQQLVIDTTHKKHVASQPSHYFHVNNKNEVALSTARSDYIPPIKM